MRLVSNNFLTKNVPTNSCCISFNLLQKSTVYSCLVQDEMVSSEMSILVNVVDRNYVLTCPGEKHMDVLWPETAPGSENIQECPQGFAGTARRSCSLQQARQPQWLLPDYSSCLADELNVYFEDVSHFSHLLLYNF